MAAKNPKPQSGPGRPDVGSLTYRQMGGCWVLQEAKWEGGLKLGERQAACRWREPRSA